jgi:hypothetical protein
MGWLVLRSVRRTAAALNDQFTNRQCAGPCGLSYQKRFKMRAFSFPDILKSVLLELSSRLFFVD